MHCIVSEPQSKDGIVFTLSPPRQTSPFPQKKKEKVKFHIGPGPLTLYLFIFNPILPSYFSFK